MYQKNTISICKKGISKNTKTKKEVVGALDNETKKHTLKEIRQKAANNKKI
jgi:hypothetical protein